MPSSSVAVEASGRASGGYAQVRPMGFGLAARHRGSPEPRGHGSSMCDEPRRSGRVPALGFRVHRRIKSSPIAGMADEARRLSASFHPR